MERVLEVRDLRKTFIDEAGKTKHVVLDGLSFSIDEGEVLGIVGRSGCGKSTAVRIASRLIPSDSGQIILCGKDITNANGEELQDAYGQMQMIFQSPEDSFNPRKTLGWSIGEAMRNRGWDSERIRMRTEELLNEVGLSPEYCIRYPHEVSGGECQRAAIARALSISPRLLICDEASSALDVTVQAQVAKLIRRFTKELAMACIFITHDIGLLSGIADRIIVMENGIIVEEGSPEDIIENPSTACARELVAADFFHI